MLTHLWFAFFAVSFLSACYQWLINGQAEIFSALIQSTFDMAGLSVEIAIGLIGVLGGIAGTGLAWLGLRAVESLYRGYQHLVHLDPVMLATAVGLAVLAAIIAGLYPVWRVSGQPPAGLLKTL